MSKIDCNITENFLKELSRMTDNCHIPCKECVINDLYNRDKKGCADAIMRYPSEAIALVQSWSDTHSIKTRLDYLIEKFPKTQCSLLMSETTPSLFGYCGNCMNCRLEDMPHHACWNEPLEGGASGEK